MGQVVNVWHVRMRKTCGIEGFASDFQTARQRMFEGQRVKPRNQFRLTGQDAFLGIAPGRVPLLPWTLESGVVGVGLPRIVMLLVTAASISLTVAQRTAQAKLLIETVVQAGCEDIQQDLLKVLLSQAIEVRAVHIHWLTKQVGDAVVWNIVLGLRQVTQRQLRGCPKAKSNGWRQAKTLRGPRCGRRSLSRVPVNSRATPLTWRVVG